MAEFPALPLWTDALIGDTYQLTPAQFGAYLRLLIVAWRRPNCDLPNDDVFLGRSVGDPKGWYRLKSVVMAFWKLGEDGNYRQNRLLDEREYCSRKAAQCAAAGRASALKRLHRGSTGAQRNGNEKSTPTPTPTPTQKGRKKDSGKTSLPVSWKPTDGHYALGEQRGLTREKIDDEADTMRNWSVGKDEKRNNWDAVFTNWLKRNSNGGGYNGYGRPRALQDDRLSLSKAADRLREKARRGEFEFSPRPGSKEYYERLASEQSENIVQLLPKGRDP